MIIAIPISHSFQAYGPFELSPVNIKRMWVIDSKTRDDRVMVFGAIPYGVNYNILSANGDHKYL